MKLSDPLTLVSRQIAATFKRHRVKLTLGGEPTYVPIDPAGPEWSITALGPTKLSYAYAMADALVAHSIPNAVALHSTGKLYPGEINPRWTVNLLWRSDGEPLFSPAKKGTITGTAALDAFKIALSRLLRLKAPWLEAIDPVIPKRAAWVLPLDHDGKRFRSVDWALGPKLDLLRADGPAGLRLPLGTLPAHVSRRALTIELQEDTIQLFVPPLLQRPFIELLGFIAKAATRAHCPTPILCGYIPHDESGAWSVLGITADPGVLEINLPPCADWQEYDRWLKTLETAGASAGLRSFKQISEGEEAGTGGGNHLLFGGPSLKHNALFTHPRWVTSMLRYWQHHPSLSYLFIGHYVGSSSQAPRPDESANALYDLEMAYQFLEQLPSGDHRQLISETLRHLHTDSSGNTHRSEISFDKFWNLSFDGGCRGLIEFRALESMPHATWMSVVALLWSALAARLLEKPFGAPLIDHGDHLHDRYFLPSYLWTDFKTVLRDLARAGFVLPERIFREIKDWRFPSMLTHRDVGTTLTVRKAHEGWPLLCETPLEGGSTSRFVDTSIERLEFLANQEFDRTSKLYVNGRRLILQPFPGKMMGIGLRYRRSALNPSLHPGIAPQMPLHVSVTRGKATMTYKLEANHRHFELSKETTPPLAKPCRKLHPSLVTCDLRIP